MSNTLNLTIPPLNTSGPQYAITINGDLLQIVNHDHDGVNGGALINLSGQNVLADLSLNSHNLTNVRSVALNNNSSVLSGSQDVNCVYVNQNNLGFNNSNGVFVPLTSGNTIAITTLPLTNFSARAVSSNFTILSTDTYNLINIDSTGGAVTGTLPICATITPTAAMRLYIFRDIGLAAATNNITIRVAVGSGNTFADGISTSFVLNTKGGYVALYTDGVSKWYPWSQNTYNGETLNISGSFIQVQNYGEISLDSTASIITAGQYVQTGNLFELNGSTTDIINGTISLSGIAAATWNTGTTETHAPGSTGVYASASTLTLNGTATNNGTLSLPGTTNLNGTSTISGTGNTVTGTLNVTGSGNLGVAGGSARVTLSSGAQINAGKTEVIANGGMTYQYGITPGTVYVAAGGTHVIDSGSNLDNFVGVICSAGLFNVDLPSTPNEGRTITIADVNGPDPNVTTYTVNINTGGVAVLIPGTSADSGTAPSLSYSFGVDSSNPGVLGGWSVTMTYCGTAGGLGTGRWVLVNYQGIGENTV